MEKLKNRLAQQKHDSKFVSKFKPSATTTRRYLIFRTKDTRLSSGIFDSHRKNDKCSRPSTTTTTTASTTSNSGEEEEEEARRQSGGKKLSVKDLLASIPVDPITSDSLLPKGFAGAKRPKPKKPVPPPSSTTAAGNT